MIINPAHSNVRTYDVGLVLSSPTRTKSPDPALHLSPVEDLGVRDLVLPSDVEQPPETSHVKRVELLCVPAVNSPCFAGVEQGREDHGTVDLELGLKAEPSTLPDRAAESAKS